MKTILLTIAFLLPATDEIHDFDVPVNTQDECHFTTGLMYAHLRSMHDVQPDSYVYKCNVVKES